MSDRDTPMPIKRLYADDGDTHRVLRMCPKCEELFAYRDQDRSGAWWDPIVRVIPAEPNYCPYCGQAIDWEVQDE